MTRVLLAVLLVSGCSDRENTAEKITISARTHDPNAGPGGRLPDDPPSPAGWMPEWKPGDCLAARRPCLTGGPQPTNIGASDRRDFSAPDEWGKHADVGFLSAHGAVPVGL